MKTEEEIKAERIKAEAEMKAEREKAKEQLDAILNTSRPKNLAEGVTTGVGNIVSGAVGAAGIAVIAPTLGLAVGLQKGGIIGGIIGTAGGAILGVLGAAAVAIGGAISGITQIGRGIVSVPESITAPRQGKWWNERQGQWVLTNMTEETKWINSFPNSDDTDILGKIEAELDASIKVDTNNSTTVTDMFYYDALEVPANAEPAVIKRQYYLLAKKYHPDKNPDNIEAQDKFKNIAEAYQVLSDPELRQKYNTDGRAGLSPDKTSVVDGKLNNHLDASLLFAFLFGSDMFTNYIGRLSTATSALVGDSPKVTIKDAMELQKRRVTRLAVALIDKITNYVNATDDDDTKTILVAEWTDEANTLCKASFGHELVTTIGKCYNLMALIYEGSLDSGNGLPSIAQWAEKTKGEMENKRTEQKGKIEQLRAGLDMMKIQSEINDKLSKATTDEEKAALNEQLMNASIDIMLRVLWTTAVVDITSTIQETTQMVFFDTSVSHDVQVKRVAAIKLLGLLWMNCPEPDTTPEEGGNVKKGGRQLYEEAAFAAMLETVKRQDEAAHKSFSS